MTIDAQITINSNKEAVWPVITNIHDAAEIISGIEKIEILNGPLNGLVGLKWRETRMYFGKPSAIDKWVTDAIEYKFYQTKQKWMGLYS